MSEPTLECPKCGGRMEIGVIPDAGYGGYALTLWSPGPRRWSKLLGLRFDRKAAVPVDTYRCSGCSYLESYAGLRDRGQP